MVEPSQSARDALLPCPFCGGSDIEVDHAGSDSHHFVQCNDCDVVQDYDHGYTKAEAITAWNTRGHAQGAAEIERWRNAYSIAHDQAMANGQAAVIARAEVGRLRGAVKIASIVFDEYARLHIAKGTPDGMVKAKRNQEYADELRAALSPPRDAPPVKDDWFAGHVDCDGNELTTIRSDELQKLRDDNEKFIGQVRDTCVRAEKAEAERDALLAEKLTYSNSQEDVAVAAYLAGAEAVHHAWIAGEDHSEADFNEAAFDYAATLGGHNV